MIFRPLLSLALALAASGLRAQSADRSLYSGEQLVAELTADLVRHFHCDGELQLELVRPWSPPDRSAVHWELAVAEYPGLAASNMLLRIRLKADGALVDDSSLMFRAVLTREVWYAKTPISAGTTFSRDLLETRRTDVLKVRDTISARDGDDSYIFTQQISPDRLVTWHDVGRRPLVHRGQVVEVHASEGQLKLSMKALAMENGARGDLVTVRNLETRKDIPAIVVGDQSVEVHF